MTAHGGDVRTRATLRPHELRAAAAVVIWLLATTASRHLGVWLAVAPTAVLLALVALTFDRPVLREPLDESEPPGTGIRLRPIGIGVAVGVVMAAATYWLYPLLERGFPRLAGDKAALYQQFYALQGAWRRLALIPVAIAEEIVWRGLVQGTLRRRFGARPAVLGTALLYAAVQLPVGAPLLIIAAFACGLVWGGLRHSQADATAPAAAHVAWDTVVLLIMPVGNG